MKIVSSVKKAASWCLLTIFCVKFFFQKKKYTDSQSPESSRGPKPQAVVFNMNPVRFQSAQRMGHLEAKFIKNLGLENEHLRGSPASGFLKSSEKPQFPVMSRDSSEIYPRLEVVN